jgi:predicted ribosome quality control (RQC) complex YloA/Tae2 family protein
MRKSILLLFIPLLFVVSGCDKKSEPVTDKDSTSTKSDSISEKDTLSINDIMDTTKFKESVKEVKKKIEEKQKDLDKEMDKVKKQLEELEK